MRQIDKDALIAEFERIKDLCDGPRKDYASLMFWEIESIIEDFPETGGEDES